ncbi:MAG TPA: glycosyltransferase family 2 protein [Polyangiaceae bacterium]|nr:glycosyltransferase family 2 protein [Polyangiaceae bacterium]
MTAAAVALLLLLLYTYAGYPLLIALWARLLPRGHAGRADFEPTVSVCMAVYNGAEHVSRKLASLQQLSYPADKLEILVYSDGSTDATESLLRELAASEPRLRLLTSAERLGKPAGLNRLRAEASGEVLLMTDVRQTLAPQSLRALLAPLADPEIGCVSGNLVLTGSTGAGAYWRYEQAIRCAEARLGNMLGVSGSLYALRREDLRELPTDLLLDDMFVPLELVRRRKRVVLSLEAQAYDEACSDEREFSRKVRTLAGNYQLLSKLPWLLLPGRNPVWFQLVSHKLLRLLCPWALLGLWAASVLLSLEPELPPLESWAWRGLLAAQLLLYVLAACGPRAGRVGSLARSFVVLNAAALVGLWRYLRGSQTVTW